MVQLPPALFERVSVSDFRGGVLRSEQTILKLTCWGCSANPSTLEQKRALVVRGAPSLFMKNPRRDCFPTFGVGLMV